MMMRLIVCALLLASTSAFAQAPQQQVTPAEAAIQIDSMVNQVAQLATNQTRAIESLQKQVQDQQKEIADLHKKLDAKLPAGPSAPAVPSLPPKP